MSNFSITRRIEIDAGHRIMTHGSKCRHIHGHRYVIEAECVAVSGALHEAGEQAAMVLDFGFLKEEMLRVIDVCCDHGFIAAVDDVNLLEMFAPVGVEVAAWRAQLEAEVAEVGFCLTTNTRLNTRLYVVPFVPTAELLAKHWFERLRLPVQERSLGIAALSGVVVWETPNCRAEFAAD